MKKYFYTSILLFLFHFKSHAQIKGEYIGLFFEMYREERDSAAGPNAMIGVPDYSGQKKLVFKKNNEFSFEYRMKGWPCAARSTLRNCTGKYKIVGDTVYLTSRYSREDFYKVAEKKMDNIPAGKIMIVTAYPDNTVSPNKFINGFDLTVNNKRIGEFKINDTIYVDTSDITEIAMGCCSPYVMDWKYSPKDKNSNYYHFVLKREIETEDIAMHNSRILINKNELIAIDEEYLEAKDNSYRKNR